MLRIALARTTCASGAAVRAGALTAILALGFACGGSSDEDTNDVLEAPPPAETATAGAAACPPADGSVLLLRIEDGDNAVLDPVGGEACALSITEPLAGLVAVAGDELFVAGRTTGSEGDAVVIRRYRPDGAADELPYTMLDSSSGTELAAFAVSPDARLIAWSVVGPSGSGVPTTAVYIADLTTGRMLGGASPDVNGAPRAIEPIRFSNDGSVLYYAVQPYGVGGAWSSFVGRYDNLYAIPTGGAVQSELLFDCAALGFGLCVGDFLLEDDGSLRAVAYVDREAGRVVVQNAEGEVTGSFDGEAEYLGYPTWGPHGELVYYSATLSEDSGAPVALGLGTIHHVAPGGESATTLITAKELWAPLRVLADGRVIAGVLADGTAWGLTLVEVDGSLQRFDMPSGATLLDLRATAPLLTLLPAAQELVSADSSARQP